MGTQNRSPRQGRTALRRCVVVATTVLLLLAGAVPVWAEDGTEKLKAVLGNANEWLVGIASTVAGVMLVIAGLRYLIASDPGETEKAKSAMKAVVAGLAIVYLASALVAIVMGILGEG